MTQPKAEAMPEPVVDQAGIATLARGCSIEMNVQDAPQLRRARSLLSPGKKVYVSHLPKQTWQQTIDACHEVREVGFEPVPHVPVRLLDSARTLEEFLHQAANRAQVAEILLISGDYPQARGPYSTVAEVLRTGKLGEFGLRRISMAGHPEGHPQVPLPEIRRAEREKAELAQAAGLQATLLTQFFFEAPPFVEWAAGLRADGVRARLVAGISGPASIATLLRYAVRCGVGPSIRALGARPTSMVKLIGDHGPEQLMRTLAGVPRPDVYDGLHFFTFGGFLRTCEWLQRVGAGEFTLDRHGGFRVD
ncbi:methylenetetrahydrofolate reductase [Steroidobacter agaridevorans]|uniref:Methylenetetrahydrofolate reductase n=1 Tax=Steroidobacter agaridevorans TaxID=2695856 RepID=A0A829YN60_9GAMM|nr:methylenetetrahydrofolate reductase [Steroidobacter agaridevorans]GFE84904.1 methylenetetrahydrofolate reductase [Steroidobacter agaridevorans]GFE91775.1 methylenetetrahydrofolate reductase [Steroidobacter agaridevorans]